MTKEELRLQEDRDRKANWKRWGPYLVRKTMGHRAGRLQSERNSLGFFLPRSGPQPRLPLG